MEVVEVVVKVEVVDEKKQQDIHSSKVSYYM